MNLAQPIASSHLTIASDHRSAVRHAVQVVYGVCCLAGQTSFIDDIRRSDDGRVVRRAVRGRDTRLIFDWLMDQLSLQGVSDRVANDYIAHHGNARWAEVGAGLAAGPTCPKLGGYWQFHDCRYHKGSMTCTEPDHIDHCPLPRHDLRNGRLNQIAYSLFLFMRDVADGDFVGWVDRQLGDFASPLSPSHATDLREALIGPLRNVYGVSDKVLSMVLSFLLMAAGRPRWFDLGASFVVVDTLVHNFLVRTGVLDRFNARHPFGPRCYQPGGCAEILEAVAHEIDAKMFNPKFPSAFARFVQIAVWQFCAEGGLDVCNGTRIDDRARCDNWHCQLRGSCDRVSLKS